MTRINPFSLSTVPLELCANGQIVARATGFIWVDHRRQAYLITNWHVVTGRNARTGEQTAIARPEMVRAMLNTRIMNFGKQTYEIAIRDQDHKPLWFAHPVRGRGSDVVAIPLNISADDPTGNLYSINLLRSEADLAVRIGMDVFILGYPFGADLPGFPVWKRGSIASEPDLTRLGVGYMLVDTASRPGMSGAPVIRRSWGTHLLEDAAISQDSTPQNKFIGIYSGRLHTKDPSDAQFGMVWPVLDIEEVVVGQKRDAD
jgi:Trypsin-like peptidase domain